MYELCMHLVFSRKLPSSHNSKKIKVHALCEVECWPILKNCFWRIQLPEITGHPQRSLVLRLLCTIGKGISRLRILHTRCCSIHIMRSLSLPSKLLHAGCTGPTDGGGWKETSRCGETVTWSWESFWTSACKNFQLTAHYVISQANFVPGTLS